MKGDKGESAETNLDEIISETTRAQNGELINSEAIRVVEDKADVIALIVEVNYHKIVIRSGGEEGQVLQIKDGVPTWTGDAYNPSED